VATKLSNACGIAEARTEPLKVLVQVNTSDEAAKSGCAPEDAAALVRHVLDKCDSLQFEGLMTIGLMGGDEATARACFKRLLDAKMAVLDDAVAHGDERPAALEPFHLSMGMSGDYETALECGSTMIRMGSNLFGKRN
jgi:pyridoxal phosphate enzyme (YggS family)